MRRKEREITDIREIEDIISTADVCRIALANNNVPYMVTMNFGYEGEGKKKLFFHCAREGRKLEIISKNNYVCFEFDVDHDLYKGRTACDFGMRYRSVVGYGRVVIVTDNDEKKQGLNALMLHYAKGKKFTYKQSALDKMLLLRLDILEMRGKKC
jgi:nitroimidazol reductase NimA-like FMN-containing flavoprotein (pyridoxamine 5'-phosphate oxidase superfamily)